jgi:hypothetical protein
MTKTPLHPSVEELLARLQEARKAGKPGDPERLRLHRELAKDSPTFIPNLLELGRQLELADESGRDAEEAFAEVQRLLEQAVVGSERSGPAVVELGYFLDTIRDDSEAATKLYEEGAAKALETLEDAWAGLLRSWVHERTKESLEKALRLGELAEKLFPDSGRIQGEIQRARQMAIDDGLLKP